MRVLLSRSFSLYLKSQPAPSWTLKICGRPRPLTLILALTGTLCDQPDAPRAAWRPL